MPDPKDYEKEEDFMGACVPTMMQEGKDKDQAAAACTSMWKEHMGGKSIEPDTLVAFGDAVKAVLQEDGSVKLGGYLVRFTSPKRPDLAGDFFTAETQFGPSQKSLAWFNHCYPVSYEDKSVEYTDMLGEATLTKDEIGIFAEIVLKARNAYEKVIAELGLAGKLSWSSGTAPHLVSRKQVGGAYHITRWPIGLDASLTPTPAEPRNVVLPIKSLQPSNAGGPGQGVQGKEVEPTKEKSDMDNDAIKAMLEESNKSLVETFKAEAATAAEAAVKKFAAELPEVKTGKNVEVVKDEADQPFEKPGEFFQAVKLAALRPGMIDRRLRGLKFRDDDVKATGMSEGIPSDGGFLVPPTIAEGILGNMYETGTLLSLFARDPVQGNSMTYNVVAETSRADGSRWGGIQGYWGAEAATKTASKPTFRQLELKLKKVYALCVATDELLEDARALESWMTRTVPLELRFKIEDAIINGNGVGKPLGILNSGALKSATRTDASEIDPLDVGRMWAGRFSGLKDYVWLINQGCFPQLLNMAIGNQPVFLPPGGLGGLPYGTLLGRPIYETEYNPALGTLGDILLISPSQYTMIEKAGGVQYASSIHVYFTADESAFRFVYRVDGAPSWTTTLTAFDTGTVSAFVALAATT